ncbi:hypothetical protein BH10BAC4_BH10BAC4_08980 [soil metagenome]
MIKSFVSILFSLILTGPVSGQAWWEMDLAAGHQGSGDNSNSFLRNDIKAFINRDPARRNREANELRTSTEWQRTGRARKKIEQSLKERIAASTELYEATEGDTTRLIKCTKCEGTTFEPCPTCNAKSYVACRMCDGMNKRACRICDGVGILNEQTCTACEGLGKSICKTCKGVGSIGCPTCEGSAGKNCTLCRGTGKLIRK